MGTTYPQMGSTFTGMGSMGSSSMNAMPRQMQQLSMATDYNVNLVSNMMVRKLKHHTTIQCKKSIFCS